MVVRKFLGKIALFVTLLLLLSQPITHPPETITNHVFDQSDTSKSIQNILEGNVTSPNAVQYPVSVNPAQDNYADVSIDAYSGITFQDISNHWYQGESVYIEQLFLDRFPIENQYRDVYAVTKHKTTSDSSLVTDSTIQSYDLEHYWEGNVYNLIADDSSYQYVYENETLQSITTWTGSPVGITETHVYVTATMLYKVPVKVPTGTISITGYSWYDVTFYRGTSGSGDPVSDNFYAYVWVSLDLLDTSTGAFEPISSVYNNNWYSVAGTYQGDVEKTLTASYNSNNILNDYLLLRVKVQLDVYAYVFENRGSNYWGQLATTLHKAKVGVDMVKVSQSSLTGHYRSEYHYLSPTVLEHRLVIEAIDYGETMRIYAPLSWNLSTISPNADVSFDSTNNYWVVSNIYPATYTIIFLSGSGYGVDFVRRSQIFAISDVSNQYLSDSGFEKGTWLNEWDQNDGGLPYPILSSASDIVFEGAMSLRIDNTGAGGWRYVGIGSGDNDDKEFGLPEGYYYISFAYYIISGSGMLFQWRDGATGRSEELPSYVSQRWHVAFFFIHLEEYISYPYYRYVRFGLPDGAIMYIDNFRIFKPSTQINVSGFNQYSINGSLIGWDNRKNPPASNTKAIIRLHDRPNAKDLKIWEVTTDDSGRFGVIFEGNLAEKEYSLIVDYANSTFFDDFEHVYLSDTGWTFYYNQVSYSISSSIITMTDSNTGSSNDHFYAYQDVSHDRGLIRARVYLDPSSNYYSAGIYVGHVGSVWQQYFGLVSLHLKLTGDVVVVFRNRTDSVVTVSYPYLYEVYPLGLDMNRWYILEICYDFDNLAFTMHVYTDTGDLLFEKSYDEWLIDNGYPNYELAVYGWDHKVGFGMQGHYYNTGTFKLDYFESTGFVNLTTNAFFTPIHASMDSYSYEPHNEWDFSESRDYWLINTYGSFNTTEKGFVRIALQNGNGNPTYGYTHFYTNIDTINATYYNTIIMRIMIETPLDSSTSVTIHAQRAWGTGNQITYSYTISSFDTWQIITFSTHPDWNGVFSNIRIDFILDPNGDNSAPVYAKIDWVRLLHVKSHDLNIGDTYAYPSSENNSLSYVVFSDSNFAGYVNDLEIIQFNLTRGYHNLTLVPIFDSSYPGIFIPSYASKLSYYYTVTEADLSSIIIVDQQNRFMDPRGFKIYVDGERIYGDTFLWDDISSTKNITITDIFDNILFQNVSQTYSRFIDVVLTLYSTKIFNEYENPVYLTITRGEKTYSEWILPFEVIEYKLEPATYTFQIEYSTLSDSTFGYGTTNGTSVSFAYTLSSDTVIFISGDSISDVFENVLQLSTDLQNVNATLHDQILNVNITVSNINSSLSNQIVNVQINLDNVNSSLNDQLISLQVDLDNINSTLFNQTIQILADIANVNTTLYDQTLSILANIANTNSTLYQQTIQILSDIQNTNSTLFQQTIDILTKIDLTNSTQVLLILTNQQEILETQQIAAEYMSELRIQTYSVTYSEPYVNIAIETNWKNSTVVIYLNDTLVVNGTEGSIFVIELPNSGIWNVTVVISAGNYVYSYTTLVTFTENPTIYDVHIDVVDAVGLGLPFETVTVCANSSGELIRLPQDFVWRNNTIQIIVKDFFDFILYSGNFTLNSTTVNYITISVPIYEVTFVNHYNISVSLTIIRGQHSVSFIVPANSTVGFRMTVGTYELKAVPLYETNEEQKYLATTDKISEDVISKIRHYVIQLEPVRFTIQKNIPSFDFSRLLNAFLITASILGAFFTLYRTIRWLKHKGRKVIDDF